MAKKEMNIKEDLSLLQEQLNGLFKTVESDTNLPVNIEDYLVTLNSLKKRIKEAYEMPYALVGGTQTGRISSKNPNLGAKPRTVEWERMRGSEREAATAAMNPHTPPPVTNRRAAIEHTRKLNENSNNS